MTTLRKIDHKIESHTAIMPKSALNLLKILDSLEDFTISIRKKITAEIRSNNDKPIRLKLN